MHLVMSKDPDMSIIYFHSLDLFYTKSQLSIEMHACRFRIALESPNALFAAMKSTTFLKCRLHLDWNFALCFV